MAAERAGGHSSGRGGSLKVPSRRAELNRIAAIEETEDCEPQAVRLTDVNIDEIDKVDVVFF